MRRLCLGGTTQSPSYDTNFNLLGYNGLTYTYDAESRLTQIAGNSHSASFVYDGVGRCVKRVIDGVTTIFSYDQWTPVAEWDGSGNLLATNVYGLGDDEILSRTAGSTQLFYKNDPMGNVMFLMNSAGTGVEKYKYDAFGAPTITDWNGANSRNYSNFGNRFMFSGRDYLKDFGIYDMRNRAYDPSTGHFHQTDPIGFAGDPANLFRFSGNNPSLGGDPTGLLWGSDQSSGDSFYDSSGDDVSAPTFSETSEISVYNGASFAYSFGYLDEAKMDAIFGPPSEGGLLDSIFGNIAITSGTSFFSFLANDGPVSPAELIQRNFYRYFGREYNAALFQARQQAGYGLLDIPCQTYQNAPAINTQYDSWYIAHNLVGNIGKMSAMGLSLPFQGTRGTIYISTDTIGLEPNGPYTNFGSRTYGSLAPYRTFAHELTNTLSQRALGYEDPTMRGHWANETPPFLDPLYSRGEQDPDSGATVEFILFGKRTIFWTARYK
jgi:RHS repeat-associated protein